MPDDLSPPAREALEALEQAAETEAKAMSDNWVGDPHGIGRFVTDQILKTIQRALGKPKAEEVG